MLRRKPTKIELKIADKEELEQARQRATATTTTTIDVLNHIDRSKDPSSKTHRIDLPPSLPIEMSHIYKALMEVEVKLRLSGAAAHGQVTTLLAPFHLETHRQENLFFDSSKAELSAGRAVLRLRFSDRNPLYAVTLKARAVLFKSFAESRRTRRSWTRRSGEPVPPNRIN